jgi:2-haloacid dehalogenase
MEVVAPRALLLDLLMATMDSIATWSAAAGDRERGLAWRDAVTASMIDAGRYVDYDELVAAAADELRLSSSAPRLLREAWSRMPPWPDTAALDHVAVPYAFVTNCSTELATVAVERSGLRPAFTLAAEEAGWFKPRPEVYALAVERLGIDAGATRFVAGAAYDANGASGSGLPTVFVARRGIHEPLARGIRVVDALTEAVADLGRPEA